MSPVGTESRDVWFLPPNALVLVAIGIAMVVAQGAVNIDHRDVEGFVLNALIHGAIYLIGVWWVLSRPTSTRDLILILVVALCLRGLAMTALPYLTTDAFRYVWVRRIQWEGFSPYAAAPADSSLAHLRNEQIYPYINQKEVAVSLYPPLAEMIFMAATGLRDGIAGLKLTMLLFEAVTIIALLGWLKAERLPTSRVLIYAWHPLPIGSLPVKLISTLPPRLSSLLAYWLPCTGAKV